VPLVTMMDYEFQPANHLSFRLARRVIVPEAFPADALRRFGARNGKVVRYPGFKEELYLAGFRPDASVLDELGLDRGGVTAVLRPPPDGALYQNDRAVTIGMVHLMIPFAALPLYAGFVRLDPDLRRAAASLGAGKSAQWRRIVLPLTLPTVLAGAILVFVTTLGFVITPQILGGPQGVMLGVLVSREMQLNNVAFAALISSALLLATVLALVLLRVLVGAFNRRGLV
jgi:ABC-type spermidine/putrescine transport system permease subunit I